MNEKRIDGKALAFKHEEKLKARLQELGLEPHVVSLFSGSDQNQGKYSFMKQNKAHSLGIVMEIVEVGDYESSDQFAALIKQFNLDRYYDGILVQLPLPWGREKTTELLNLINIQKDIDGLTIHSPYQQATVKSVISILDAEKAFKKEQNFVVVGGVRGMVGKGVVKALLDLNEKVQAVSKDDQDLIEKTKTADILISSTGVTGLIKPNMVKSNAILIDVGLGDFEEGCYEVASRYTPKIGGVGPMTIISLMENIVDLVDSKFRGE